MFWTNVNPDINDHPDAVKKYVVRRNTSYNTIQTDHLEHQRARLEVEYEYNVLCCWNVKQLSSITGFAKIHKLFLVFVIYCLHSTVGLFMPQPCWHQPHGCKLWWARCSFSDGLQMVHICVNTHGIFFGCMFYCQCTFLCNKLSINQTSPTSMDQLQTRMLSTC